MTPMRNALVLARKELAGYFASPIAYIVIGVFALLFGYFYYALVVFFDRQSMQIQALGPDQAVNINELLIRPVLINVSIIILFVLPMITMRTYAEEKRSGTIELLLTAPLTDVQIVLGKFLGAMGLYATMLAVTVVHIGVLFWLGEPEWRPVVTGYLGLLLMGGCFVSVGLLASSLTRNQIVAAVITFTIFLLLWVIDWIASFTGPTAQAVLTYLSLTGHLEDFTLGILDTRHIVYYVSVIAFGLFLTVRSVDTERWRG
jgi:ABC-2 type transport system permease protein